MKITIWIRSEGGRTVTLRHDTKYESRDTPTVCAFGRALVNAITNAAQDKGSPS